MEELATQSTPAASGDSTADDRRRADISPLHLLKAEDLPASISAVRKFMDEDTVDALRMVVGLDSHDPDERALAAVAAALSRLGPPAAPTHYTDEERLGLPEDLYEEHDVFFGAVRVTGNPVQEFTRTMLEAVRGQLHDALSAGVTLGTDEWDQLRDAFCTVFRLLWRVGAADTHWAGAKPDTAVLPAVAIRPVDVDPLVRWRLGHQVFFALIQALVVAVGCVEEILETEPDEACRLLEDATVLMIGSGAALRFAGDFTRPAYADVVRPAMMPPHINAKFSGLQLRDHRMLLKGFGRIKPLVAKADPEVRETYGFLVAAMSTAYDAHVAVCARFGGDREPSLRTPESAVAAVDVLDRFRAKRIRAVSIDGGRSR